MKIKIVGFKVGKSYLIANKTVEIPLSIPAMDVNARIGSIIIDILCHADFISIRRID